MRRWMRRLAVIAAGAVGAALLGAAVLYAWGGARLAARHEIAADPAAMFEGHRDAVLGERLATVYGCRGCHTETLGGQVFLEDPMLGRIVAPNLTAIRTEYTDADFVRLLRHGVRPDGTGVLPAMPAQSFAHLADEDLAAIIAYVRSVPTVSNELPSSRVGLFLRAMLVVGQVEMVPDLIDHDAVPPRSVARDEAASFGAYLARSACSECHGPDLTGQDFLMITPHLAIAASYTLDDFTRLLRTGIALGNREVGTMSSVARTRFARYTDQEIQALHTYLKTLAAAPGPAP